MYLRSTSHHNLKNRTKLWRKSILDIYVLVAINFNKVALNDLVNLKNSAHSSLTVCNRRLSIHRTQLSMHDN